MRNASKEHLRGCQTTMHLGAWLVKQDLLSYGVDIIVETVVKCFAVVVAATMFLYHVTGIPSLSESAIDVSFTR